MLADLQKLIRLVGKDDYLRTIVRFKELKTVHHLGSDFPIGSFSIGSTDPSHPVLFVTGGVHGLERIGAQLAWSLLKTTVDRLIWDRSLQHLFQNLRLAVIPLANPVGYQSYTRCNGNNVDLMRNSPIEAIHKAPFLLGGHRYSEKLPWYQGKKGVLEPENQALVSFFESEASASRCVVSVDFHSGFGMKDRIWFPFSYTETPFDDLPAMHSLTHLFEQTHPYHIYQIEPQSKGYLINGDIWDYLYLNFKANNKKAVYLPLTLEMGSWTWVRKNPIQIFRRHGVFNPIKEHRVRRTYRRHHLLFDFLLKALGSHEVWSSSDTNIMTKHRQLALERWYEL